MSEKQDLINSAKDVAERAWIFYTAVREAGADVLEATFLMRQYIIETMITSMHSKDGDTTEGKDHNGCWCRACWVDDMLDEVECFQPSDVAPVAHGRWIYKGEYAVCTECGGRSGTQYDGVEPIPLMTQFCPNCGAKMDEGVDDG